jgi:hypothetical protein
MKNATMVLALGILAGVACSPKKDTANPDGDKAACTEEAKQCADGSSVSRQGPDCEFPACPGEGEAAADAGAEPDADAEPQGDGETPPEGEEKAAPAEGE